MDHVARQVRHARQVDVRLDRQLGGELERALADVHGEVTDALEVGGDLERRGDEPEISRRRLMQREQLDAEVVDLDVQAVDRMVTLDGGPGQRLVAFDQRPGGVGDLLLDQPSHLEHLGAEVPELGLVDSVGVDAHQPKRPVM